MEALRAHFTLERSNTGVSFLMSLHVPKLRKLSVALVALVGSLACVNSLMHLEQIKLQL